MIDKFKINSIVVLNKDKSKFGTITKIYGTELSIRWEGTQSLYTYSMYGINSFLAGGYWTYISDKKEILQFLLKH
jgi:hypothetical protein